VSAIRDPIIAQLSKETAGRFSEADAGFIEPLFPAVGDDANTIAAKRAKLNQIVSEKMNFPTLQAYGINLGNVSGTGRFTQGGEKKIQLGPPRVAEK